MTNAPKIHSAFDRLRKDHHFRTDCESDLIRRVYPGNGKELDDWQLHTVDQMGKRFVAVLLEQDVRWTELGHERRAGIIKYVFEPLAELNAEIARALPELGTELCEREALR